MSDCGRPYCHRVVRHTHAPHYDANCWCGGQRSDHAAGEGYCPDCNQFGDECICPAPDERLREKVHEVVEMTANRTGWEDANTMRDRILRILRAALEADHAPVD
jgi:hypothetical protein